MSRMGRHMLPVTTRRSGRHALERRPDDQHHTTQQVRLTPAGNWPMVSSEYGSASGAQVPELMAGASETAELTACEAITAPRGQDEIGYRPHSAQL